MSKKERNQKGSGKSNSETNETSGVPSPGESTTADGLRGRRENQQPDSDPSAQSIPGTVPKPRQSTRKFIPWLGAILSGFLTFFAFPSISIAPLIWICLVPLILGLRWKIIMIREYPYNRIPS